MRARTVLVEGESDRAAVEALARARGVDLAAHSAAVVAMGGAHAVARVVGGYGPEHRLAVLCDARESRWVRRALAADVPVFVCTDDLEDELIRCLGTDAVLDVIAAQGELDSFRTLQRQPAQRERPVPAQLQRFFGGRSGHKITYAPLLVEALPDHAPEPLEQLLAWLRGSG